MIIFFWINVAMSAWCIASLGLSAYHSMISRKLDLIEAYLELGIVLLVIDVLLWFIYRNLEQIWRIA